MECPRCSVPNLPGLALCVDCGQDLHAEPQGPTSYVPTVTAANPLDERRPRPPRSRLRLPRLPRGIPVGWLVTAAAVLGALSLAMVLRGVADPVFSYGMEDSLLPTGRYTVDDGDLASLQPGELVLLERDDLEPRVAHMHELLAAEGVDDEALVEEALYPLRGNLQSFGVFPVVVVALEGQRLDWSDTGLRVDGEPCAVTPPQPWPRARPLITVLDRGVPPQHVAVWDWVPYPEDWVLHLLVVPRAQIMGRLTQPDGGDGEQVPVPWPPDTSVTSVTSVTEDIL